MPSLYSRLLPGRSETDVRADSGVGSAQDDVAVGRIIREVDERRVASGSLALAEMMFGRQLRRLPDSWLSSAAYGVVTNELVAACQPSPPVQLAPGWGHAVAEKLDARFFVVETRALQVGAWSGTLGAGGEHLFDELLALVAQARAARITPVLISNGTEDPAAPASFTLRSTLQRLGAVAPGSLSTPAEDTYAPPPSPVLAALALYAQGGAA